jgi:hypothetical protein
VADLETLRPHGVGDRPQRLSLSPEHDPFDMILRLIALEAKSGRFKPSSTMTVLISFERRTDDV